MLTNEKYFNEYNYDISDNEKIEFYKLLNECGSIENIRKRLMPEGMEWPRFEDGEQVLIGDKFAERINGTESIVKCVGFNKCAAYIIGNDYEDWIADHGTHCYVKRPKPVYIGADGLPLKIGEIVSTIKSNDELIIDGFIEDGSHGPYTVDCHLIHGGEQGYYISDKLIHIKIEQSDSWEKLEEDAIKDSCDYFSRGGNTSCD